MQIELENIRTQETHVIDPDGMIFGRAGSSADIQLRDQAVSKKHARVYADGDTWFLEDLGSSNGTYVDRQKISGKIELTEGMVFALSRFKFRVARIGGAENDGNKPLFENDDPDDAPAHSDDDIAPPAHEVDDNIGPGETAQPDDVDSPPPVGGGNIPEPVPSPAGGDGSEGISPAYFMVAVPKAFFQFVAWVPALALAPWVVIPKGVQEQKHPAMGKLELAAYAMPALFISTLLPTLGAAIAALIGGAGFGAAIGGTVSGLITAIIVAIVAGLIWGLFGDKVTAWIIDKLQGQSDERARTNYFIATFTALIVAAAPQAIGTAISTVPYVRVLSPLIIAIGSLVALFLSYTWMKYFQVHKAIPIIILVLAGLTGLGGIGGAIGIALSPAPSSSGPDVDLPDTPDGDDPDDNDEKDEDTGDEKDEDTGDDKDEDTGDDKDEDQDDDDKDDKDDKAADKKKSAAEKKKAAADKKKAAAAKKAAAKKAAADKKNRKNKKKDDDSDDNKDEDIALATDIEPEPDVPLKLPEMDFDDYHSLAEDIDELIKEDPILLRKPGAKELYRKISAARYEARKKYESKMAKTPQHELVHEAEREAQVYQATAETLKKLESIID